MFDIETAPILGYFWKLWDENIGLNQIKQDWFVLSWAAKWLGDPESKIMYQDQRHAKNLEDDKKLLQKIWSLLNESDIVITQNGKRFDQKKLNARFIINGFQPPGPFKHIDTKEIASGKFAFTSNSLAYLSDKLCVKYKKSEHQKFHGFTLWRECLKGNPEAWREMEKYNKLDILSLEEVYQKLAPWDNTVNFNLYKDTEDWKCKCGSTRFKKNGYWYLAAGKYQTYRCLECGHKFRGKENLLSKDEKKGIFPGV